MTRTSPATAALLAAMLLGTLALGACGGGGDSASVSGPDVPPASNPTPPTPPSQPPGSASWVYYKGVFYWGGDYSYAATPDYADTSGAPLSGPYDIAVTITGAYGGFQPYAGGSVPLWNFIDNGYTYLTFSIKPTVMNQSAQIYFMMVGDVPVGIDIDPFSGKYGPPPQQGVWSTYKIPLSELGVANTSVYKFAIQDMTGLDHNVFYLDNIGFE